MSPAAGALVLAVVALLAVGGAVLAIHGDRLERDRDAYERGANRRVRRELAEHHPTCEVDG